jgi:hypothetical protein
MGGRSAALYPRDESMRYKGDPTGERLTPAEMAQKVKLEKCFGGRSQPGPKGRMPIKGPMPAPGRVVPDYGPVGSRRPPPSESVRPPPPTAQGGSTTTNQDAVQPPGRTPPPAESRMARARGEGARRKNGSAAAGASVPPAHWDTWAVPATRLYGSGTEIGTHDGTDGAGNATSVQLLCPHRMWSVIERGHVGAKDLPTNRTRDKNRNSGAKVGNG